MKDEKSPLLNSALSPGSSLLLSSPLPGEGGLGEGGRDGSPPFWERGV